MAQVPAMMTALADPNGPSSTPLSIGSVLFRSEECPSELAIGGGEQKISVQELDGGGRVVQSHGVQFSQVTWSGSLYATYVDQRVRALRAYLVSGQPYLVVYIGEAYYGIVRSFQPKYRHANWCEYTITLEITQDANGEFSSVSPTSIDAQNAALLSSAMAANTTLLATDPDGASSFQADLSNVQLNLQNAGPIAQTAGTTAPAVASAVNTAVGSVGAYAAAQSSGSATYVPAQQLLGALTLIAKNVAQGQSPTTVRAPLGISLYALASQVYGDVTRGNALQSANGLTSPRLSVSTPATIVLPPFAASV